MRPLILLLLAGCSSVPTSELEDQLFACDAAKAQGCDLIRGQLEQRYRAKERREARDRKRCESPWVDCYFGKDAEQILQRSN